MSEWKNKSLAQFVTFQRGFDLPKSQFISGDIPVFGSTSILGYHNLSKVVAPGVITGRSGTLGKFQYSTVAFWPHNTTLWVKDFKGNDPKFSYYLMQCFDFSDFNGGGAVPTLNRNVLKSLKVDVPPLQTQQKIAKILSNYDDLIENNLKRIKLLEESARLIYEEWFLRFRIDGKKLEIDPDTDLPFGWQDVLLTDYIDLLRGVEPGSSKYEEVKTDSNIPFIRVGDLSKRDSDIYVSKDLANNKIIDKDDILLSLDGSPGKVRFGLSGCYSTGIRKAVSKQKNVSSIFIYNLLNSPYIQGLIEAYATGATILHAGSSVKKMRLVLPTDEVLDKYNNIEMKKFQLILNLSDENKLLKEARDILLPRLMTGMIDTDDLDIAV